MLQPSGPPGGRRHDTASTEADSTSNTAPAKAPQKLPQRREPERQHAAATTTTRLEDANQQELSAAGAEPFQAKATASHGNDALA